MRWIIQRVNRCKLSCVQQTTAQARVALSSGGEGWMRLAGGSKKAASVQSTWVGDGKAVLRRGEQIKMEITAWKSLLKFVCVS